MNAGVFQWKYVTSGCSHSSFPYLRVERLFRQAAVLYITLCETETLGDKHTKVAITGRGGVMKQLLMKIQ